ncbi:MAG TPA: universal stress protein [Candidatus Sulfotelmatobacter sp.]|nr:universal stress protein [Candidatus Sulfotelmatobacter sp.]
MSVTESQTIHSVAAPVFHNILVATDFSDASRRAVSEAVALAAENHAQVSVVHVAHNDWRYESLDNPPQLDLERIDAQMQLESSIHEVRPEQNIRTILIKHGPAAEAIAKVARENAADLLVLGTRGRGGLPKLALGSVAEQALRIAPCPVITVGPQSEIPVRADGSHPILFATDFDSASTKALPLALAIARNRQARLILIHMMMPIPATSTSLSAYVPAAAGADELEEWQGSWRQRTVQKLKDFLPSDTGLAEEPEFLVGTDFLSEGILAAAERRKAGLIVMGATRKGMPRVSAHFPWSAVHEVVRYATCPVLTVAEK